MPLSNSLISIYQILTKVYSNFYQSFTKFHFSKL